METARMNAFINVPIEQVWAVLTDYEGYARIPGVEAARLVRPGRADPAGVGAVREISVMGSTFEEEIVTFDPPRVLEYRIIRSRPLPIEHQLGRCELTSHGSGTEVTWTTTMGLRIPLLGDLLAKPMRAMVQNKFNGILLWLKDELEGRAQPPASP
jgi:uncharacterized protein YndB with AHSA1/START domain